MLTNLLGKNMNEDNLNMEIRKFLKNVGISSQRIIENIIYESEKKGLIKSGDVVKIEMKLSINSLNTENIIKGEINLV